jgi:sulfite oxidase
MLVDERSQVLQMHKHPAMLVHGEHPLNLGAFPQLVGQAFITPQPLFFVRNHGTVPRVNLHNYYLLVTGLVRSPLQLSLSELRVQFPASTVVSALQCAGHRRAELAAIRPIPGEIPWAAEAIGNAQWCGVPLREVLLAAGIEAGAEHVAFTGLDEVSKGGEYFSFGGSIPLEKALQPEVLLAYEMNGEPLPPLHGFPLRVLVPGYIGARSVKWLAHIHVQHQPSENYFQRQAYRLFSPDVQAEGVDWEQGVMLAGLPLNSVICQPREGETLAAGPVAISGYAIAGEGHLVKRVELSCDGGATWTEAALQDRGHPWAWCFWKATLDLPPGQYLLTVRAWDSSGRTQLQDPAQVWNWKGYLNHAWHRVDVFVQ